MKDPKCQELAPLWFSWLRRAWLSYRQRWEIKWKTSLKVEIQALNENHPFIHIGIFMSGSLKSSGFMHLICMQLFRQKKEPKTNVILEICSVGRRSNLLFSQKWCGWNRSLEAILDVPETGEVSTWNHSLLQRNTKPKLHTSQHLILILVWKNMSLFQKSEKRKCRMFLMLGRN